MECPQIHFSPPIVIRLDYADGLATASSEGQKADILNEGVDAHGGKGRSVLDRCED